MTRHRVLKALTRKFQLREDVSLYSIAKKCPPNFTGADMYALCADAWFHAAKRKVLDSCLDSAGADDQTDSVIVEYNDFVKEYRVLPMNYKAYGVLRVGVEENFQSMVGFVGAVFASVFPIYRLISV